MRQMCRLSGHILLWGIVLLAGCTAQVTPERYEDAERKLLATVRDRDPRAALVLLRGKVLENATVARFCHQLAHEIGHEAYAKYGTFARAMEDQDEICNSGYMHGVIESHFARSEDITRTMKEVCAAYSSQNFQAWQCYHGTGHGAMFVTKNDLPRSLELCGTLDSSFARQSCANGVFMENFNTDLSVHPSRYLDAKNPLLPCPSQTQIHKADCYLYAPMHYLSLHPGAYAEALEWCANAETEYRTACSYGVGMQSVKERITEPLSTESLCDEGPAWARQACVTGMVELYINHFGSLDPAKELCLQLRKQNRDACAAVIAAKAVLFP